MKQLPQGHEKPRRRNCLKDFPEYDIILDNNGQDNEKRLINMIRCVNESDYTYIIGVLDKWWGGRRMADMLPRLFFKHFSNTSFVFEEDGKIIAFLIGFASQTYPGHAYIHFLGIHPEYRKAGLGRQMYQTFFDAIKLLGCSTVHLVTSPVNKNSISFHQRIGFEIVPGDCVIDGISIHRNYDGPGEDRVVFQKDI